jgi:PAS domain S-box-containing protein
MVEMMWRLRRAKTVMISMIKRFRSIRRASCVALLFALFAPGPLHAAPATQLFVLHSYSQEYPWTRGQHEAFMQALAADSQVAVAVSTEYLDTKRRDYDETYARDLARHLRTKYDGYKPAAIYVTDDNALLFARDHLSRVFPGTPVFFSAVNDYDVRTSIDPSMFTGVFELKEVAPNIEWLLSMDEDANDLVFIGDGSNTYQAIEREARKDLIAYRLRATFVAEKRLDHALARLRDLPGKYLLLTTLGGMTDANGRVLPLRDIMKSLVDTGRIVISMEDAYILEGVLGGYVTSARQQGISAARLLLAHLHGKPVVDLPPILKSPNALIFDDRALHRYGITLPENLRARAVLLNPHPGIYEQHRSLILGSLIGLAVLLFLVVTGSLVIVSRKNGELALARNSAESANIHFNQLAEQSRTVQWEVDAGGLYTYVSPVSYAVMGYRPEELVGKKHFHDLLPEEGRDADRTAAFEYFVRKEPFHDLERTARAGDGRLIWLSTNGIPVLDDHGTLLGYRGSDSDITGRKHAEEALRENRKRLSDIVEFLPDATMAVDREGRVIIWNKAIEKMTGVPAAEMIGKGDHASAIPFYGEARQQLMHLVLEDHEEIAARYPKIAREGDTLIAEVFCNALFGNRGAWVFGKASPLRDQSGNMIGAIESIRDITERKQAEEEKRSLQERLNRSEKMEALGTLAGGVAHDLNNVLGIVVGYAEMILDDADKSSAIRPHIVNIMNGGQRAAAIVQDLLTLARRGVSGREVLNLNRIIADCRPSPEFEKLSSYHPAVKIETHLEPDLPNISGSSVHLAKSLYNLVSNACEAMAKGGELTIRTANQYLDGPIQGYDQIREGNYVVLAVSDTGEGIPEADLKHIFEPFYTKKVMGRSGTGLGLAVVWGTVKDHHGYINVQSEEGKGSVFTLYFPVTREGITAERAAVPISEYMGKGESILVVDDVKEQRDMAAGMLGKLNYNVSGVSSGEDAVAYLKEHEVDLMVLDMIMDPGMDGLDTYRSVLEIRPKQKAIIVSGFSESDRVHAAQTLGAGAYVRKPYVKEKLGLAVRKELDLRG